MNLNKLASFARESSLARFLILAGVILVVFGFIWLRIADNTKDYVKTKAVVTRAELYEAAYDDGDTHHEATYDVFVRYTADGKEYETELGILSGRSAGDEMTIAYDPGDPERIIEPTGYVPPIVCITLGAASVAGGAVSIAKMIARRKRSKEQEESWKSGE